ncbi:DEKNAAC100123 [Brettanomyces naardenensis]|uniref:DEKNAAC100123 n=1 Tax=Brettanomyces naardenensis TaxID=13370 RepID=A0A448YG63_BRENA|nr:DEKNAAC100123 [Brettanomyces naardenensis]
MSQYATASSISPSSSPDSSSSESHRKRPKFRRNYLACLNCRTRKVKCDLGDVESPHGPPCARCKRERKECIFVESKRGGAKNPLAGRKSDNFSKPSPKSVGKVGKQQQIPRKERSLNESGSKQRSQAVFSQEPSVSQLPPSSAPSQDPSGQSHPLQNPPTLTGYQPTNLSMFAPVTGMSGMPNLNGVNGSLTTTNLPSAGLSSGFPPLPSYSGFSKGLPIPMRHSLYPHPFTPPSLQPSQPQSPSSRFPPITPATVNTPEPSTSATSASYQAFSEQYTDQPLTNNATMVFLAHIAGKIAHADRRDRIDGKGKVEQLEADMERRRSSGTHSNGNISGTTPRSVTPSVISAGPSSESLAAELPKESFGHASDLFPTIRQDLRLEMPPIKSTLSIRISPTARLSDIEYIGPDGIMTEDEARRLIKLFFSTMHPFFPYIPKELHSADVLPGYPMLLCAILTVAARYHQFIGDDSDGDKPAAEESQNASIHEPEAPNSHMSRHLKVHEQLWIYCQRLFSMTVWGESSSRSIGTLLSFLLFTEWNPRAIHFRWSDYANTPEDEPLQEEYAGLSAMKRSELMSFMLIGTATRLSFLLPDHPLTFLATHVSETSAAVGLNKRSMLAQTLAEVDINSPHWGFANSQKAAIELLQFFSLCYETLYGQHPKFGHLNKYQNLAILDILSPILENWYQKYHRLLKPSNPHSVNFGHQASRPQEQIEWLSLSSKTTRDLAVQIQRESLILDYYYAKLYLYSLALSGDTSVSTNVANSKKGRNLRLDELVRYSRYVELAYKAAKEILAVTQRVHRLKLLKFMPVRWVTRIIKSVSFIVKCYLTLTTDATPKLYPDANEMKVGGEQSAILQMSVIPVEEIVSLLQKTAICLRDAAPDELHLCTRYSTILMYLCSQFKSKMRDHRERLVVDYEKEIRHREAAQEKEKERAEEKAERNAEEEKENETVKQEAEVHPENVQPAAYSSLAAEPGNTIQPQANVTEPFTAGMMDQQLFDDYFSNTNPSETLFTWFASNNSPGLDFVDQFTKEMEMDFINKGGNTLAKQGRSDNNMGDM